MLWGALDPKLRRPGHRPQRLEGEVCLASGFGAMGPVAGVAPVLQSLAKPGFSRVGPTTRAATEGVFEWADPRGCHRLGHQAACGHLPGGRDREHPGAGGDVQGLGGA